MKVKPTMTPEEYERWLADMAELQKLVREKTAIERHKHRYACVFCRKPLERGTNEGHQRRAP